MPCCSKDAVLHLELGQRDQVAIIVCLNNGFDTFSTHVNVPALISYVFWQILCIQRCSAYIPDFQVS